MALPHLYFPNTQPYASELKRAVNDAERIVNNLESQQRLIAAFLGEDDGSLEAHYTLVASRFGFESNADAMAAKAEIDSAVATCKNALLQLSARLA